MAPRYPRKTTVGGVPLEPERAYAQPTVSSVTLTDAEKGAILTEVRNFVPSPRPEKTKPLILYREILSLSRQNIADLFDRPVTAKVRVPILGDPSVVEQQIVESKMKIKEVQELLVTRSAAWQKRNRPEDILPSDDRERLKYREKKELKELQTKVRELQARLRTWGANKEDYVGEEDGFVDMTFEEKHPNLILSETTPVYGWVPFTVQKKVRNAEGGFDVVDVEWVNAGNFQDEVDARYCIANYRKLVSLGVAALDLTTGDMSWEGWTRWENAAILVAITEGLVQPDMEVVSRHPKLNRWEIVREDVDEDDHEAERKIILKTGGGALGGATIFSRGWRYGKRTGWTQRALESFDETARARGLEGKHDYSGDFGRADLRDYTNDDNESYDPN